ncbi:Methyl-accepting chemotaxis protein [Pseudomonas syringae pv. actinidiae]|uniref:Methyl-accepting chemotaxis protein n=1 Tax=Pseudomonas syringae pv. actinidiae TaxID=103796 RepID=A0A2V0Q6Y9_PSESF|nr:Methyl-accepting chemotaxis protein [Pseudomonas syringae pv. actinidiae]
MRQIRNSVRLFDKALQSAQIVDQREQHYAHHQTDTDLCPPTLNLFRKGTTTRPLDQIKQQMPPVQDRNGQQIQNTQAYAQIGEEIQKISKA